MPAREAIQAIGFLLARSLFFAFVLVFSCFCILAFLPYSYVAFTHNPPLPALRFFAVHTAWIFIPISLLAIATQARRSNLPRENRLAFSLFALLLLLPALWFALGPWLTDMPNDFRSYWLALAALAWLLWQALLDRLAVTGSEPIPIAAVDPWGLLGAAGITTLCFQIRGFQELPLGTFAGFGLWGLLTLGAVFSGAGLLLAIIDRSRLRAGWLLLGGGLLGFAVLRKMVIAELGFYELRADLYAAAASIAGTLYAMAALRHWRHANGIAGPLRARTRFLLVAILGAAAVALQPVLARQDWNFVLQKLLFVGVAMGMFLLLARSVHAPAGLRIKVAVFVASLALWTGAYAAQGYWAPGGSVASLLEQAEERSIPLAVTSTLWRPTFRDTDAGFYELLRHNTNLLPSAPYRTPEWRLAAEGAAAPHPRPYIFMIVIDSLRRDYVSAYNPRVDFTPSIGAFASENLVFQDAFTRYGATAMSEPAIWSGSLLLHLQYPRPFERVNNLLRLARENDYRIFVTRDPVLAEILPPPPEIASLLPNVTYWTEFDLVPLLQQVEEALQGDARPGLFYIQAQNIHTITLFQMRSRRAQRRYPGFDAKYASELERADAAFGAFIGALKQRGLYDNSIVIVTADHGDSLGEQGRVGHSVTIFPEVLQIPLIVHLPAAMRRDTECDLEHVAFNSDLTPTLFALLGHSVRSDNALWGRPLCGPRGTRLDAYRRERYMVASSHGPAYGVLAKEGSELFIADAISNRTFLYRRNGAAFVLDRKPSAAVVEGHKQFVGEQLGALGEAFQHRAE